MKLKKIVIHGFKSFADRVTILFEGGVICIVGPNGCGKSNIADAFRWVMGEQSSKSMRSPKMTDVIFSGTSDAQGKMKRKPLNFAEVSITLADVGTSLDIPFEEVEITRRLHRSGESEYFLNRQPARLKDIQDLLSGSGVGKNAISIFEQGKIDQVIQLSPEERRSILEEVAGTSLFIKRKQDTLRRLGNTDQNLVRLQDIFLEVGKQKDQLEKQALLAGIYKEKKERLELLDQSLLFFKWEALQERLKGTQEKAKTSAKELEELELAIRTGTATLFEQKKLLEEREQVLKRKQASLYEVKSAKEVKQETHRLYFEKRQEAEEQKKRIEKEKEELVKKVEGYQLEKVDFEKQQETLEKRLQRIDVEVRGKREETREIEGETAKLREQQIAAQRERLKLVQMESQAEGEWKQTEIRIEGLKERLKQSKERAEKGETFQFEQEKAVEKQKEEKEHVTARFEACRLKFKQEEECLKDVQQEIQEKEKELKEIDQALAGEKGRQKVLEKLKEEMQGFSTGAKILLQEGKKKESPLFGLVQSLSELFNADLREKPALSLAMRPYSQTLVTATWSDFDQVMVFAKERKIRDFSLLCKEAVKENLGDHFLCGIKPIDEAKKMVRGSQFFLPDGAFVDAFSVLFYPGGEVSSAFQREAELKGILLQVAEGEAKKKEAESSLQVVQEAKKQKQQTLSEADKAFRKEEMELMQITFSLKKAEGELVRVRNEQEALQKEKETLEKSIQELNIRLQRLIGEHAEAKKKAAETNQLNLDTELELEDKVGHLKRHQRELREKESTLQQTLEESQKVSYHLNLLSMRLQEADQLFKKYEKDFLFYQETLSKMHSDKEGGEEIEQLEEKVSQFKEALEEEEKRVEALKQAIGELDSDLSQKREQERALLERKGQQDVSLSEMTTSAKGLERELEERYQKQMGDDLYPSLDIREGEKELRALRRDLEEMGPVNMAALEEQAEYAERHSFLNLQIQDLEKSRDELKAIITELENESRRLFQETFDQVREHFKKNFTILFQGGEADLLLVGEQDLLQAGVEIIAKPPGKQMRSIQLLSGGEKCMTALALLFAIFEVRPAPFSILDEIDAPLDDTNIERFVNVLKQFTSHSQFVIVTHNKRTMAIADRIYGVTMEEKGVSKILSLEFDHEHQFKELELV